MDERFRRAGAILGDAAMKRLSESRVAVLGLGGVGSWCAEALCRSGVGTLYLLDQDTVSLSNVNRQLFALTSTLDMPKAEAAAERLRDIAPGSEIVPMVYRYAPETRDTLLDLKPDFIRLVAALGTGNKKDASLLRLTDLAKTEGCPFARVVRRELRRRGITHLPVVYSPEEASEPDTGETPPPGRRSVPGSLVWVPASAGLLLCQYVVTELAK